MSDFLCEYCRHIYDKQVKKIHNKKTYCLNCYTMLFTEVKKFKRKRTKLAKKIFTVRLNEEDFKKIESVNKSELVRNLLQYAVNHPKLLDKVKGGKK